MAVVSLTFPPRGPQDRDDARRIQFPPGVVTDVEHRNRFAVRVKDTKERGAMRVAAAPTM